MAELIYGAGGDPIVIPEELMAHVKVVITAKFRRNESFMLSWRHADGHGRSAVWLQPSIPLRFVFHEPEAAELDHRLLADLAAAASSNGGLELEFDDAHPLPTALPRHPTAPPAHTARPAA